MNQNKNEFTNEYIVYILVNLFLVYLVTFWKSNVIIKFN